MSLLSLFSEPLYTTRPHHHVWLGGVSPRILDSDEEDDILPLWRVPRRMRKFMASPYYRQSRQLNKAGAKGAVAKADKDQFQVNIDVQQFTPDEITVKATGNNTITVEGKHEERPDEHGSIYRHFVRRYVLPKGHDIERVESRLSSDGVLTITAPKISKSKPEEREIPVIQTNKPTLPVTESKEGSAGDDAKKDSK